MKTKFQDIILTQFPETDEPSLRTVVSKLMNVVKENESSANIKEPKLVTNENET